ncbi:MAG TPA: DNA gyrase subunit A [Candidatus Polarisedimenticolia bacterium]|jgi:DNA gyrase subunit A|nr:DNA gyrase subunit A [Candidatus Polarisedimenticolia bacterium]
MDDTTRNEIGALTPITLEDEMRRSYLDYAMSVIVGRALPDVRDGFKPVHRRVLYAMHEAGNTHDKPYKKAARIVGDVMGKYHPHGDTAIYDTLVRLAQDFSMRYPIVDGQGNFGSIDGDAPAAMRYTEVRMARLAHEMLADIEKETVDFGPNYDGQLQEPLVLPSRLPNLLVNGSSGIAVGMATNIPPHNLSEICDALVAQIEDPEITIAGLMEHVKGPDFPTSGYLMGMEGIRQAYTTGRGSLIMRARATVEEGGKRGRDRIVITEIPYQVNKTRLIEQIAALVNDKRVEGITDIRDESDRDGIRVVCDLRRDAVPRVILNQLFKHTQMQESFGAIFLAIVNNRPAVLNLKQMLQHFIEHRREVIVRRTQFDLGRAEERAHILEGLKIALDNLDEMVALIRQARTPDEARQAMRLRFRLSEVQATSILEMRLQRLTGLERQKIVDEYTETLKEIARLREILANERLVYGLMTEELREIKKAYGDARRTEIMPAPGEIAVEDLIVEEEMVITVSHAGYMKRNPLTLYRSQRRGGKGRTGMTTREEDFVEHLFVASTHASILIFTTKGRVHWLKVHEIPQIGAAGKGKNIINFVNLTSEEKVAAMVAVKDFVEERTVVFCTRKGIVKKTPLAAYGNPRAGGIIAIGIDEGDELLAANLLDGKQELFMATSQGQSIRFPEEDVRPMGRGAHGVIGMRLEGEDAIVEMDVLKPDAGTILTVTGKGYAKRTEVAEYRLQGRGGSGIINLKVTDKTGPVVQVMQVADHDQVMVITAFGKIIRTRVRDISLLGRPTQGVRLIHLEDEDTVVAVARVAEGDDESETGSGNGGNGRTPGDEGSPGGGGAAGPPPAGPESSH